MVNLQVIDDERISNPPSFMMLGELVVCLSFNITYVIRDMAVPDNITHFGP